MKMMRKKKIVVVMMMKKKLHLKENQFSQTKNVKEKWKSLKLLGNKEKWHKEKEKKNLKNRQKLRRYNKKY